MKKITTIVALFLLFTFAIPITQSEEAITLQFWTLGTDETTINQWKTICSGFEVLNPGIKVEITGMPNTISEYETKLNAALLGDTYPDVLNIVLAQIGSRGVLNDFEILTPYIDTWDQKDNIYDSAYTMGKYEGKQIAIGSGADPKLYVYRKDMFEAAGLDPEAPPLTWDELATVARALTIKDDQGRIIQAGISIPAIDSSLVFTEPYLRSNGSLVIDEINLVPSFTDEGAIAALDFIGDLYKDVSIPFNYQNAVDEDPFYYGRSAITQASIGPLHMWLNQNPEMRDKIGYIDTLRPSEDKEWISFCGYQLFAMGASSRHKDAAWKLIAYLMGEEALWMRYEYKGFPPVLKSLVERYVEQDPVMNPHVLHAIENGKGKAAVAWVSVFNKYVANAYEEVINGKKDAKTALTDAEKALLFDIE
jgi:multiple sugar transport system substrate-binding protein